MRQMFEYIEPTGFQQCSCTA